MKRSFIVTIDGTWLVNGKPVTQRDIEKALRYAVKQEFEFLATKMTVVPNKQVKE